MCAFHLISLPDCHELLFLFLYLSTTFMTLVFKGGKSGHGWSHLPEDQGVLIAHLQPLVVFNLHVLFFFLL